jgi:hypothetical protein
VPRLFRRSSPDPGSERPQETDEPVEKPAERRTTFRRCAYCKQAAARLVYCDNGKEYCRPCFFRARTVLRLNPVGRRAEDLDPFTELNED